MDAATIRLGILLSIRVPTVCFDRVVISLFKYTHSKWSFVFVQWPWHVRGRRESYLERCWDHQTGQQAKTRQADVFQVS